MVDQFRDDDEQNCKAELAFALSGSPVGAPSELPKIGEPRVRSLDRPAQTHGVRSGLDGGLFGFGVAGFAFLVDDGLGQSERVEGCPDGVRVVSLVEVEGAHVEVYADPETPGASWAAAGICKLAWYKQDTVRRMMAGTFTYDQFMAGLDNV